MPVLLPLQAVERHSGERTASSSSSASVHISLVKASHHVTAFHSEGQEQDNPTKYQKGDAEYLVNSFSNCRIPAYSSQFLQFLGLDSFTQIDFSLVSFSLVTSVILFFSHL